MEKRFAGPEKELSRDSLEKINKARENLDQVSSLFQKGLITGIQVSPQEHIERGRNLFILVNISLIKVQAKVLESENYAEVLDGVKEGESIIVEGHFTLAHDSRVQNVN